MTQKRLLRVLICSGNLGNAQPDTDSIAAWIPYDGSCEEDSKCSDHPIILENHNKRRDDDDDDDDNDDNDNDDNDNNDNHHIFLENHRKKFGDDDNDKNNDNCNGNPAGFNSSNPHHYDIIVIGLQESTFDFGKAVHDNRGNPNNESQKLSSTTSSPRKTQSIKIDPNKVVLDMTSPVRKLLSAGVQAAGSKDHTKKGFLDVDFHDIIGGSKLLADMIKERCPSYEFVVDFQRGEMRLIALVRSGLTESKYVTINCVRAANTGVAGVAANKGGILVEMSVDKGSTKLSFLTVHLAAHEGKTHYKKRCADLHDIFSATSNIECQDTTITNHFCFVCGDLNFRTNLTNDEVDAKNESERESEENLAMEKKAMKIQELIDAKNWTELNAADELHHALRERDCLVGFTTPLCNFPPTFKVERKHGYEYLKNRTASYTDRILWKCAHQLSSKVKPIVYEPVKEFCTSDHKPVRGAFEIELNERVLPQTIERKQTLPTRMFESSPRANKDNKTLHLFFNQLKCYDLKSRNPSKPWPYVSFASEPAELVRFERSNWRKFMDAIGIGSRITSWTRQDGSIQRTTRGWARTSKKTSMTHPDWSNEEIHLVVMPHRLDGRITELTGSILYMTVHDQKSLFDDNVIGTFSLNLANLYKKSRSANGMNSSTSSKSFPLATSGQGFFRRLSTRWHNFSATSTQPEALEIIPDDNHSSAENNQCILSNESSDLGNSIFSFMRAGKKHDTSVVSSTSLHEEIQTFNIDEPLLKNGKEQGRITCSLDTWWLSSQLSTATEDQRKSKRMSTIGSSRANLVRTTGSTEPRHSTGRRAALSIKTPDSVEKRHK